MATIAEAYRDMKLRQLDEARWNEKVAIKGLAEFRKMYETLKKAGINPDHIKMLEKVYEDLVIDGSGAMYSSKAAERAGILKIDGKTKYKNQNY